MVFIRYFQLSYVMSQYPYFVCPIAYSEALGRMTMDCEPSQLFRLQEYNPPQFLLGFIKIVSYILITRSNKNPSIKSIQLFQYL